MADGLDKTKEQEQGQAHDQAEPSRRCAVRVRDNQRRARQRHKAYVQDLERKVKEYEQQGVHATLEMQRAARGVAAENARLRTLLRRRGVDDGEVEQFLMSSPEASHLETLNYTASDRQPNSDTTASSLSSVQFPATQRSEREHRVSETTTGGKECCDGKTTCSFPSVSLLETVTSDAYTTKSTACVPSTSLSYNSATTMSCSDAAKIMADMQGHGDIRKARTSLGCGGQDECSIKNTALFQILEGCGE